MSTSIEVKNLSLSIPRWFRPDVRILKNITLTIEQGEAVAIIGQSGSGKTTLRSVMMGNPLPFRNTKTILHGDVLFGGGSVIAQKNMLTKIFDRHAVYLALAARERLLDQIYFEDEAFRGLDQRDSAITAASIQKAKRLYKTSIYITHYLPSLAGNVDKIIQLSNGSLIWEGTYNDLRGSSANLPDETATYLRYAKRAFNWKP